MRLSELDEKAIWGFVYDFFSLNKHLNEQAQRNKNVCEKKIF